MSRVKQKLFQAPKGMHDILPQDQPYWERISKVLKDRSQDYGFERIDTPILEDTELYEKGTGLTTDIVEKELYSFRTKGGDQVSLRPEGTPGVVRAYLENGMVALSHPVKLYYFGPMFRYERPQAGRFRQHYQMGFEVIGGQEPVLDVQIIQFFLHILKDLGIKNIQVQINSLGCSDCRPAYRRALIEYYRSKKQKICPDCQRRLKINPLRLLDCKEEKCQSVKAGAPMTLDYLCKACHDHFKIVLEFLDELEIPYFLNQQLVRGLDYYTKTVFEIFPEQSPPESRNSSKGKISVLPEAKKAEVDSDTRQNQSALGGGGRYDGLVKLLGGKPTPAVGVAAGIERIISFMKEQGLKGAAKSNPKVFLVQLGEMGQKKSLKLFSDLHEAGVAVAESLSKPSIKSQLKIADKLGVAYSLILGQQEALDGTVIIRDMESGVQETVPRARVVEEIKRRLARK